MGNDDDDDNDDDEKGGLLCYAGSVESVITFYVVLPNP